MYKYSDSFLIILLLLFVIVFSFWPICKSRYSVECLKEKYSYSEFYFWIYFSDEKSCSSDGIISHRTQQKELSGSTHSLPRQIHLGGKKEFSLPPHSSTAVDSSSTSDLIKPPPKPSRVPSFKVKARKPQIHVTDRIYAEIDEKEEDEGKFECRSQEQGLITGSSDQNPRLSRLSEVYHPSGSDSGNGSGDSIQPTNSDARKWE